MPKKIAFLMVSAALLAGLVPLAVKASVEGSLVLVLQAGLTVTVDQEILCTPCNGRLHWGDPAGSTKEVFADDNSSDQSFTYAQAGCYEPRLEVRNSETNETASYSAGRLAVGPGASCTGDLTMRAFFPQVIHQEPPPTPTPTVTPTPTPTATPDACPGDPIDDPSFEARCGWDFSGALDPWNTRTLHKDGSRSLGLGVPPGEDDDVPAYSQASQWITIPDWADTLRGYYYSESEESGANAEPPDRLAGGNGIDQAVVTDTVFLYLSRSYDDDIRRVIWKTDYDHPSWESFETDISFLRGQTILLIFGLGTDGDGDASRVYFDHFTVR